MHSGLEKKNVQRINGIVRPYIQAIKREQDRTGVLFIDITEGTSHTGPLGDKVFIKSEAKLPIWDYLDQIDFEAKLNPSYKRNSRRIRIEEARKLAQKLKPYKLPKKQEPTLYQQVEQALKQAGGNINRAIELLESAGYYDFRIRELLLKYLPPKAIDLLAGRAGGDPPPESQDADKSEFNGVASVDDLHFEPEESTAAAAGAGRNGHIEEQENIGVHSESGKSPKVQFMITHEMKQQLHDLGYPRDVVSKLKPEEASSIIEEDKTYVTWQAERDGHPLSTEEWEENLDSMTASVLTHY